MLARSRSSIFLTGISGQACTLHARVRQSTVCVQRWAQRSRIKFNVFPFLVQTDVGGGDELRILP